MAPKGKRKDRLSSLPDPLLIHILSFLPITEAVKTMLIKPFGNLWTFLPNLDLHGSFFRWDDDDNDGDNGDDEPSTSDLQMFRFTRNLLMRHRNPKIDKFRVHINEIFFSEIEDRNLRPDIDSWINFALGKHVEVLEFFVGFPDPSDDLYKLPHSLFISDSLIELNLKSVEMKLCRRVQMRSLQILTLLTVNMSDEVFREIIRGCPLLKELEIDHIWGLNELSFDAPNVEKLKLLLYQNNLLRINCPNLRSFDFTGFVDSIEVINLSSLVEVTLNLACQNVEFKEFPQFISILKKVLHAKTVSLSSEFVTVLFYCVLKDIPYLLFDWRSLELSILLNDGHISGLNRLLHNSTCLEKLVIHLRSSRLCLREIESELNSYVADVEGNWSCLKSIAIHNISKSSLHLVVRLVEIVLKKAVVLNELVIYYKGNDKSSGHYELKLAECAELVKFCDKLVSLPKASQHAKIMLVLLGTTRRYTTGFWL